MTKQMGAVPLTRESFGDASRGCTKQFGGGDITQRQMGDQSATVVQMGTRRKPAESWPTYSSGQMTGPVGPGQMS